MTIACEKKEKPSDQLEPALNSTVTKSEKQIMGAVEKRATTKAPSRAKDATSGKGGAARQLGARQDPFYLARYYYNYYYPGHNQAYGLWDGRMGAQDGLPMASQATYFHPSGMMNFYGPAGMYPSFGYPKQVQIQNSGPMVHRSRVGEMWNGRSGFKSREKSDRKGDCEVLDYITCGPRVNEKNNSLDAEYKPSGVPYLRDDCNMAEFQIEYGIAKFYIIKSYSEDDIHKSIKYNVWSSTQNGNKKLDAAFHDAAFHDAEVKIGKSGNCPVFLFFSVNQSGQFVGLAEMIGKVDFNQSMEFWQLDKWSGFFPVKWHIIKDIPNAQLRHIRLQKNGKRPVTYTRDAEEIGLNQGLEMLKIFKSCTSKSSILDDFEFYEKRSKHVAQPTEHHSKDSQNSLDGEGVNEKGLVKTDAVSAVVDLTKNLTIN